MTMSLSSLIVMVVVCCVPHTLAPESVNVKVSRFSAISSSMMLTATGVLGSVRVIV